MRKLKPFKKTEYPWIVGYRLKKSRQRLEYPQAIKRYKELKKYKTRFMHQDIPLGMLVTRTLSARSDDLVAAVMDNNVLLSRLRGRL